MKKVSIVVPAYNQGEYLSACLDSIWFQDYEDIENFVGKQWVPADHNRSGALNH